MSIPPVSGTESDSDSILTPDWNITSSGMAAAAAAGIPGSLQQQPLSSIAERRSGSGGEDSEDDDDDEGEGGWKTAQIGEGPQQSSIDEGVIKAGYLWKKGERRKVWNLFHFILWVYNLFFSVIDMEEALVCVTTSSYRVLQNRSRVPTFTPTRAW